MKLKERDYWLGFNVFNGIGPKRFAKILKVFGNAEKAWEAGAEEWKNLGLPSELIEKFLEFREIFNLSSYKLRLEEYLIRFLTLEDKEYPKFLKKTDFSSFLIYIKGGLKPQDVLAISVVGTRKITSYGRQVAEKVVSSLVSHNVTIVSGLARGVDSVAHRSALSFGGRTLAVLGHGLDMVYPPENKGLAEQICGSGALISQFPLGVKSVPGNFPARNKIIAGLSLGVVVIEGASDSGALITANFAKSFGRPVFAVPGPITSSLSAAPSQLIKDGAELITSGEDILQQLKISTSALDAPRRPIRPCSARDAMADKQNSKGKIRFPSVTEEKIWQLLAGGIKHLDEIVREVGLPASQVSSNLTTMELQGMIKNLGNGEYCL